MKKKKNCENKKRSLKKSIEAQVLQKNNFCNMVAICKKINIEVRVRKNWRMHLFRFGEKWHFPKKCYQLFDKLKCSATNSKIKSQYFYYLVASFQGCYLVHLGYNFKGQRDYAEQLQSIFPSLESKLI